MPLPGKRNLKIPLLILVSLLPFEAVLFFVPGPMGSAMPNSISNTEILELANKTRAELRLQKLKPNPKLEKVATLRAKSILNEGYFSHQSMDGNNFIDYIKKEKYGYMETGENLAIDFTTSKAVVLSWLKSESHKKNMLNPNFEEAGISSLTGKFNGADTTVVVLILAKPIKNYDK